jgi:3-oxoacyl-[acyl-carrier protein] reductase
LDLGLDGRLAVVCGASSGIGLGCARVLAAEGCRVVLVARNLERLRQAEATIRNDGGAASALAVDLGSADAPAKILAAAGAVDILVTNPGLSPAGNLTDPAIWPAGIAAIVAQTLGLIGAVVPSMRARRFGRIVNIASSGAFEAGAALGFSGALRAALIHAAASLARDFGPDGVTVNNIAPGPVRSDGLRAYFERRARETGRDVGAVLSERMASIPTRRFAEPEEIGRACAFLCAPSAASISGRTILMDGGANDYPFL